MKQTAVNIKTTIWKEIISGLRERGWVVTAKYYGFDAGIDDDFLILRKGVKKILLAGRIGSKEKLNVLLQFLSIWNLNST